MAIQCYAAYKSGEELKKFSYDESRDLDANKILLKVTHCGICHSDLHLIDNDWSISQYPLVPGHEIIGTVERVGKDVKTVEVGQRVGIGWQSGSCRCCEWCVRGEENLCVDNTATAVDQYGGFAEKVYVASDFVFPIPEDLDSATAAPLLCGGITVYSPIRRWIRAYHKVGVVGIGGLGHLALQFAKAFGCHVTAFSHTQQKESDARAFGADVFVNSVDATGLKALTRQFDFLIVTVNVKLDWDRYLSMLRPNGQLIVVGAIDVPMEIPAGSIISGQKGVVASVIGSRHLIREMLEFSSRHKIRAQVEVLPFDQVNAAIHKLRNNDVRYRMVLKMD